MLSITDILDFIDLDRETVQVVRDATRLPEDQATSLAEDLLKSQRGIYSIHQMFRDEISKAAESFQLAREQRLRKAYTYFARKYPVPRMF